MEVEIDTVTAVLLHDGTWHSVVAGTFDVDPFQFVSLGEAARKVRAKVIRFNEVESQRRARERAEAETNADETWYGARWREPDGALVICRFDAVLALRAHDRTPDKT